MDAKSVQKKKHTSFLYRYPMHWHSHCFSLPMFCIPFCCCKYRNFRNDNCCKRSSGMLVPQSLCGSKWRSPRHWAGVIRQEASWTLLCTTRMWKRRKSICKEHTWYTYHLKSTPCLICDVFLFLLLFFTEFGDAQSVLENLHATHFATGDKEQLPLPSIRSSSFSSSSSSTPVSSSWWNNNHY